MGNLAETQQAPWHGAHTSNDNTQEENNNSGEHVVASVLGVQPHGTHSCTDYTHVKQGGKKSPGRAATPVHPAAHTWTSSTALNNYLQNTAK